MPDTIETNIDDLYYEDKFYENEYEELNQEQEAGEEQEVEEVVEEEREAFFVCDDCTKQWDQVVSEDDQQLKPFCPNCGSSNITEI